ncbi:MAG: L,D-transpeptidase family protein [Candidatus Latescibacteria bacterium]|nr:L,D-transpeptidase family protein [Candidatus Latescibacterota bacterium]
MNFKFYTVFFILLFCTVTMESFPFAQNLPDSKNTSTEIQILKKFAASSIKKTLEKTNDLNEAATILGVETDELEQLCILLDIEAPFKQPEIEPVAIPQLNKLADDKYWPEVIVEYNSTYPYVIIVEKDTHTLMLFKYDNGKRQLIDTFECKTGKNHGDKKTSGDERTPEGIYFLTQKYSRKDLNKIVGKTNAYLYGEMAFVTDFPNAIDHLQGKGGSGIWLHGTDEPFDATSSNKTRGCVVTTNETIKVLDKYISVNKTPMIIVNSLDFIEKSTIENKKREVIQIIEGWRSSWEDKRVQDYIEYYSPSFESQGMTRARWKKDKEIKWARNNDINIKTDDYIFLEHNGSMVVYFNQHYSIKNTNYSTSGFKTLYLVSEDNSWKIVAEHFQ